MTVEAFQELYDVRKASHPDTILGDGKDHCINHRWPANLSTTCLFFGTTPDSRNFGPYIIIGTLKNHRY
jgi:hypothetical protein